MWLSPPIMGLLAAGIGGLQQQQQAVQDAAYANRPNARVSQTFQNPMLLQPGYGVASPAVPAAPAVMLPQRGATGSWGPPPGVPTGPPPVPAGPLFSPTPMLPAGSGFTPPGGRGVDIGQKPLDLSPQGINGTPQRQPQPGFYGGSPETNPNLRPIDKPYPWQGSPFSGMLNGLADYGSRSDAGLIPKFVNLIGRMGS